MLLYRISNCVHAQDIGGTGAKLFGGRWNSIGVPLHYMAVSRALAALEVLANKNSMTHSTTLCLTVFEIETELIKNLSLIDLPENWKDCPAPSSLTLIGDEFVEKKDFLLLKVPSVIIEDEFNYLMNVNHSNANTIKILEVKPFSFDDRLF